MSSISLDISDDIDDIQDDDINDNENMFIEEEEDQNDDFCNSPQKLYRIAINNMGFDDLTALSLLIRVYDSEEAPDSLKGKAICRAIEMCSNNNSNSQFESVCTKFFDAYESSYISSKKFRETIQNVFDNVQYSEEPSKIFLSSAISRIDQYQYQDLYLILRLRECEIYMQNSEYEKTQNIINEVKDNCPFPPNPDDFNMCRATFRLLMIQIEFADINHDEEKMIEIYHNAFDKEIIPLDNRQLGYKSYVQGIIELRDNQLSKARNSFFNGFKLFDKTGSDKRLTCLAFLGLVSMLLHEKVNVFQMPEIRHYISHPIVAPISQLDDAYQIPDIVLFNKRVSSAQNVFYCSPFYNEKINEIRRDVLEGSIVKICPIFQSVTIDFLAQKLESDPNEIYDLIIKLIVQKRINGGIDITNNFLTMKHINEKSKQLDGLDNLIASIEKTIDHYLACTFI